MLDRRARAGVEQGLKPLASALGRTPISPDGLTALGLVASVATGVLFGAGHLILALVTLILSGVTDILDGNVAKASGQTSKRGAFFDSVSDRFSDGLMFGGAAWYLTDAEGGHTPILALAVLGCSQIISYERAKAESLGYEARGGLMERAERMVLLGLGLAFTDLLVPVLWVMLALTGFTAIQRFVKVWRQADAPPERQPTVGATRRAELRSERSVGAGGLARARRQPRQPRQPRPSRAARVARGRGTRGLRTRP